MAYSVRVSDIAAMSEEEKAEAASRLIPGAADRIGDQAAQIEAEISSFEDKYEITSEVLMDTLYEDTYPETAEVATDVGRWVTLLHIRRLIGSHQTC